MFLQSLRSKVANWLSGGKLKKLIAVEASLRSNLRDVLHELQDERPWPRLLAGRSTPPAAPTKDSTESVEPLA